jgi:hypothetical protein
MYNTALNNLICGKPPGNLEMRAKNCRSGKTVDPMTKRCTVKKGQHPVPTHLQGS